MDRKGEQEPVFSLQDIARISLVLGNADLKIDVEVIG